MSEENFKLIRIAELREEIINYPKDEPDSEYYILNIIGGLLNYLEDDIKKPLDITE